MARTERMNASVRLAFCLLVFIGSLAFLVTVWRPYSNLGESNSERDEAMQKLANVEKVHEQKRHELDLLRYNSDYRELRARDMENRSMPGEQIFRIKR